MDKKRSHKQAGVGSQASNQGIKVLVASDWAPIRTFDALVADNPASVYGDLLPLLRSADLRIVNCECALTSSEKPVWKSGATFKGRPEHVRGLTAVPFDVACLANNHIFDYGLHGFKETLDVLRRSRIRTVGAGLTEDEACAPLVIRFGKSKVSLINISEGEDLTAARGGPGVYGWEIDKACRQVRHGKRAGACVLVIAHCGLEYVPYPPTYVASAFRRLVDAGADCIMGHHPHVPQGIEYYRGCPIAYSLGNFVFYQHTDLYYRKVGYFVTLHIKGNGIAGFEIHPYRITDSGLARLKPIEEREFRRKLERISRPLRTEAGTAGAWQAFVAYYGIEGFLYEVSGILERMKAEPQKGAAMFRNRITTAQHYELWRDFLTRVMAGDKPSYSQKAYRIVQEWFTRRVLTADLNRR
jgi:poly-gamma-glutamate capsule biosynthesis protein CapA/YwtB (metallophosphatase superfamily)